eukprot:1190532-Prorocentrum_minimum.AAC.2
MLRALLLVSLLSVCQRLQPATGLPAHDECKRVGGIPDFKNSHVCCAATCGRCGGENCQARPGGADACCGGRINSNRRMCSHGRAPCLVGLKRERMGRCLLLVLCASNVYQPITLSTLPRDVHSVHDNRLIATLQDHLRSKESLGLRQDIQALKTNLNREHPMFNGVRGSTPDGGIPGTQRLFDHYERVALIRQRVEAAKSNTLRGHLLSTRVPNGNPDSLDDPELEQYEGKPDLWYDFKSIWDLLPKKSAKPLKKSGRPDWHNI